MNDVKIHQDFPIFAAAKMGAFFQREK